MSILCNVQLTNSLLALCIGLSVRHPTLRALPIVYFLCLTSNLAFRLFALFALCNECFPPKELFTAHFLASTLRLCNALQ